MKKLLLAFLFCFCGSVFADEIAIDTNFPGGNIIVNSIKEGEIHVQPDLRTSPTWFFYAFKVKNAQGKKIHFIFDQCSPIGSRGPAISTDGEKTWHYLSKTPDHPWNEFTYTFGPDESCVLFAQAILYTQKDWEAFVSAYRDRSEVRLSTLCKSRKGRDVELMEIVGNENAPFGVALTCRHHCCEMTASLVLEGILAEALSDSEEGKWLRQNVRFYVVPFVDKDGVEDGDQGKNRKPHDHNRDYNHEFHPEIKALKAGIVKTLGEKSLFFLDLHCPWLRSGMNEYLYSPMSNIEKMSQQAGIFFKILEKYQKSGEIPYEEANNLPFGKEWNNQANYMKMEDSVLTIGSKMWAGKQPNAIFAGTIEMPYSNSSGVEVTRENSRELGHNIARSMVEFLKLKQAEAAK